MSEHTYSRLNLAIEQLEVAVALFLEGRRYASSITLAGAAEEIFGKKLQRRNQESVLEWKFDQIAACHKIWPGDQLDRKAFHDQENRVRNALKHFDQKADEQLTVDLEEAACWMIVRAAENARRLELNIERYDEFESWFYENIVGY